MMALSYDFGIHWQRPECAAFATCRSALNVEDSYGTCSDPDYFKHCYMLPDTPALPGALAYDWDTLFLFLEKEDVGGSGQLWYLNNSNFRGNAVDGGGWSEFPNDSDGGYGRKVFIRGTVQGSGCWFSTDFLAEDVWVYANPGWASHNNISIAPSANGPWRMFTGVAPWTPRASAAIASSPSANVAWLGSGVTMVDGDPVLPSFGDVWQIDAGVCLLDNAGGGAGKVCNGHGTPNLDTVTCVCSGGYSGARCQLGGGPASSSSASKAAGITFGILIPLSLIGFVFYVGGPVAAIAVTRTAAEKAYGAVRGAVGVQKGIGSTAVGSGSAFSTSAEAKGMGGLKSQGYGAI